MIGCMHYKSLCKSHFFLVGDYLRADPEIEAISKDPNAIGAWIREKIQR